MKNDSKRVENHAARLQSAAAPCAIRALAQDTNDASKDTGWVKDRSLRTHTKKNSVNTLALSPT